MNTVELAILCHYYACDGDYRDGDFNAPVVRAAIDHLLQEEMLFYGRKRIYDLGRRGQVFMEAVKALPWPVEKNDWVMP